MPDPRDVDLDPANDPAEPVADVDEHAATGSPRQPSRLRTLFRRRSFRISAALALVAVLVVGADRVIDRLAESRVASMVADALSCGNDSQKPATTVGFGGFPFLSQLAGGTFKQVRLSADDLELQTVRLRDLSVSASDVKRPKGGQPGSVGDLDVAATVPYSALPNRIGQVRIRFGSTLDGRLTISPRAVGGLFTIPVSVVAQMSLKGDQLTITPEDISVFGIPSRIATGGTGSATAPGIDQKLPALPAGLTYQSVRASPRGITVSLTGHDLTSTTDLDQELDKVCTGTAPTPGTGTGTGTGAPSGTGPTPGAG